MIEQLVKPMNDRYEEYLHDESKLKGYADSISFPKTEEQVIEIVKYMNEKKIPITIQGGKTGISGGAVPYGGHIMNLSEMKDIVSICTDDNGQFLLTVQSGLTLNELNNCLKKRNFNTKQWDNHSLDILEHFKKAPQQFWPPDPTEASATIGGIASHNAQGICSNYYGSPLKYIDGIRVVINNGQVWDLHRGQFVFQNNMLTLPDGNTLELNSKALNYSDKTDLIDIFIGGEGMFGVITSLTLRLIEKPTEIWGICFFFEKDKDAISFSEIVCNDSQFSDIIVAIEYMDKVTMQIIENFKKTATKLREIPNIDSRFETMIYLEIHTNSFEKAQQTAEWLMEKAIEFNSDIDSSWAFSGESEIEKIHVFRHAAPESVNVLIDSIRQENKSITKLGTDMQIPYLAFKEIISMYRTDINEVKLNSAIFGHVKNGHLHVNLLPRNFYEYQQGKALIINLGIKVCNNGGCAIGEHGVGKLKKELFLSTTITEKIIALRIVKKQLDPNNIWNQNNMFDF